MERNRESYIGRIKKTGKGEADRALGSGDWRNAAAEPDYVCGADTFLCAVFYQ